jgi:hypothetical protein
MIITVPLVPPSPNELRRKYRNPHAYRRLRKLWEDELFYGASCSRHRAELIDAAKKGRMRVQITVHHPRIFDQDNLPGALKPILDALVNIHFLANDDREHLELLPPAQIHSTEKKTVIVINRTI